MPREADPARPAPRRHAVIVDDERLARRELRTLLEEAHRDRVHVVGEAATVADAARLVEATDADLVFLDITLQEESGFDLLSHLGDDVDVVFVTAHDAYAIRAFAVNALDYLLKPVEPERIAHTVARLAPRVGPASQVPAAGRSAAVPILTAEDRLFVRLDGRRTFVRIGDIVAIRAAGDESLVHLAGKAEAARVGRHLGDWEARLPERTFIRVHRSAIINLAYVHRVDDWSHASLHVHLRGLAAPVTMSRRYAARLRARLG